MQNDEFNELLWQKGKELYRDMPWRQDARPYYVLVSELMLQQTQVPRVIPKFEAFIAAFPDAHALAHASLADVLTAWQGLGYNRRAKFLHEAAKRVVNDLDGKFPQSEPDLLSLPGVGKNTAGAISAYAFNHPAIFVETNIRTVYIHHFFDDSGIVDDKQIIEKLTETLDCEHPREFYWSLMDYGSWLKSQGIRNVASSKHYKKQSPLEGSVRQVRGQIIRQLAAGSRDEQALRRELAADDRFERALAGLKNDGLVAVTNGWLHLTK